MGRKHTDGFLLQTAEDYDMDIDDVIHISEHYPRDEFYERLEEFIKERANRQY
jgi:poly(A) polymerase Pap1